MKNKKKGSNRFFYLLLTPLLLAFIVLVVLPLLTYSNNMFSDDSKLNTPIFLNNELFFYIENLDKLKNIEQLTSDLEKFNTDYNLSIIKDNKLIYNLEKLDGNFSNTIRKTISINNIEGYDLYISTPIFTKKIVFAGLLLRYLLLAICIVTFLSINRIRRHIIRLREVTDNIASGDYDTPIKKNKKDSFEFLDDSLENMRLQIKEDQQQISRFFAGVSHDLKTPLSSIMGYTQALKDGLAESKEDEEKYLDIIYNKSFLLEERITSLMNYIRISDQGFTTRLDEKELYFYLEEIVKQTESELSLKNIEFEYNLKLNKKYKVKFDKTLIDRVFENLIENALKYGDISKPIRLVASQNYEGIIISLSNYNKLNVTKDTVDHLFEPFYRGDNSRKGNGFGLGLATVKSIILSHQWKIKSELNEKDNTIVFSIIIPNY